MVFGFADHRDPRSLAARLRRRRMLAFAELLAPFREPVRVVDLGGTADFWRKAAPALPKQLDLTIVNLRANAEAPIEGARHVAGDARHLPQFADDSFDICFSNSVIEHVGSRADQAAMASEVRRLAPSYYVQTPNRYFPVEPHFLVPGFQFLPLRARAALHHRYDLGWIPRQPDEALALREVEEIVLLDGRDMRELFPDAHIRSERFALLTKSFIAIRRGRWQASRPTTMAPRGGL